MSSYINIFIEYMDKDHQWHLVNGYGDWDTYIESIKPYCDDNGNENLVELNNGKKLHKTNEQWFGNGLRDLLCSYFFKHDFVQSSYPTDISAELKQTIEALNSKYAQESWGGGEIRFSWAKLSDIENLIDKRYEDFKRDIKKAKIEEKIAQIWTVVKNINEMMLLRSGLGMDEKEKYLPPKCSDEYGDIDYDEIDDLFESDMDSIIQCYSECHCIREMVNLNISYVKSENVRIIFYIS